MRHAFSVIGIAVVLGATPVASGAPLESGTGPSPLRAGVAEGLLRVPVGAPLGGYLRPPLFGDVFFGDDPGGELLDFVPEQADDGTPLAPVPDELRAVHSPYATYFPPSRGYYDSLITKAVALFDGEDWVVLVKNDLIGMLDEVVVEVGRRVEAETGIDLGSGLVLSGTHTHDGPGALANHSTRYFWLAMDAYQPELFDRLVGDITRVVVEAVQNVVPARFGTATGLEAEGDADGDGVHDQPTLNSFRRTRGIYDPARAEEQHLLRRRIGVLRIDEVDDGGDPIRPLAVVFNYPAHGIAFDVENMFFSGDVLASAEREIEALFEEPVVAMLVQSVGGDVSPRADGGPTLQRIERWGKLLAPQVKAIWDGVSSFDTRPDLDAFSQRVILDRERLGYEGTEFPYPFGGAQCNASPVPEGCLSGTPPDPHDFADNQVGENGSFLPTDTRVAAVRIGSAVLLAQPGEPLGEYGLRVLEAAEELGLSRENTFIWGYSNDHVGYILPDLKEDWLLAGTEGTTTFWGWKQGGRLLDVNVDLMKALQGDAAPPADELEASYLPNLFVPTTFVPVGNPGNVRVEPADVERFATTRFVWEGGDPVVDLPRTTLERLGDDGLWHPMRRPNGKVIDTYFEMHLEYQLVSAAHQWTVRFEPPKDWPVGTYRFVVSGSSGIPFGNDDYRVTSSPFDVTPSPSLLISGPVVSGGEVRVTLAYTPRPDNYRTIDPLVASGNPAPVREGRVTFRDGSTTVVDATPIIDASANPPTATYAAEASPFDPATLVVSGEDAWGNRTP